METQSLATLINGSLVTSYNATIIIFTYLTLFISHGLYILHFIYDVYILHYSYHMYILYFIYDVYISYISHKLYLPHDKTTTSVDFTVKCLLKSP
jgi:hypothetical protein